MRVLQFLSFALLLLSAQLYAQETPVSIVSATSEAVRIELLKENGSNTDAVRAEVEKIILPRFDFARMTALAVGKYWRTATPEQKTALSDEFRVLLTRTYYTTMLRYRNVKVNIAPDVLLENDGKQATVKTSVIINAGQQPVKIDYVLYNTEKGWQVFNVVVEGASLVTVYRNQFADEVNKGGIAGLIQSLRNKNAQPAQ
ncbi:MAG: ABC transporter substrate-binding protein [Pseudomonadales bacterium]